MRARFTDLTTHEALERVFADSTDKTEIVFKHSVTCPISHSVFKSVSEVDADIHLITVQRSRDISNAVAEKTGIRHESPQALIIKDGTVVYHASHYDIEPADIVRHV